MHNIGGTCYEQTLIFLISFLIFSIKIQYCLCHLKDMGEHNLNMTDLMDQFENRILGGETATLEEYPFNVQFFNFGGLCGGSILTRKTVLTAAHCFDHNSNIAEMKIISNSLHMYNRKSRIHEVWDYTSHELYNNPVKFSNDIAVIIIHDDFKFGSTVQKAFLAKSDKWMSEKETGFVATGWGITETRRRILKKARLRYVSSKKCSQLTALPVTKDMFCLYGDQKADTCNGDSGGGVLWNNVLVGIVSHGGNCLQSPGAYANVYYFGSWINNTVNQLYSRYCNFHKLHHEK